MTVEALPTQLRTAKSNGSFDVDDPGADGTFKVGKDGGWSQVSSGTRFLPLDHKGVRLTVYSIGTTVLKDLAGNTVADIEPGEVADCLSNGSGWRATIYKLEASSDVPEVVPKTTLTTLQAALDGDITSTEKFEWGKGGTEFTTTLDIDGPDEGDPAFGGALIGQGSSGVGSSGQNRKITYGYWSGTRDGSTPMIRYSRGAFAMRDFSLFGDTTAKVAAGTATDGDIGILLTTPETGDPENPFYEGMSVGKLYAENLYLANFDVAIQSATQEDEYNCDSSFWNFLRVGACDTMFRQYSHHSLGHFFNRPEASACDCMYELYGGGDITSIAGEFVRTRSTATSAAVVRYRNDTVGQFGLNGGFVTVDGLKLDAQVAGVRLLDMETVTTPAYNARVMFRNIKTPLHEDPENPGTYIWGGPMFVISGQTHVIVDGMTCLYPDSIRWSVDDGTAAQITIQNVTDCIDIATYADALDTANSYGDLYVRFTNNAISSGAPLEDYVSATAITGDLLSQ